MDVTKRLIKMFRKQQVIYTFLNLILGLIGIAVCSIASFGRRPISILREII
jgi:hypothetical protein